MSWTDKKIERLKVMWADGKTASEIATALGGGISRSAVCGKVARLNLAPRVVVRRGQSKSTKVSSKMKLPSLTIIWDMPEPKGEPNTFVPGCQYIHGDIGTPWRMCGHDTVKGPWCTFHASQVYQRRPVKPEAQQEAA